MNEKYGIEFELLTGAFNKQMQEVKKQAESIKKAFDPNDISGIKINDNNLKNMGGYLDKIHKIKEASNIGYMQYDTSAIQSFVDNYKIAGKAIDEVKAKQSALKQENQFSEQEKRAIAFEAKLRPIIVKMERLKAQQKELNQETGNISANSFYEANTGVNNLSNGIKKATSKVKRFALSLLGIRSIFSLVSRASSAYLSQDTALANKLQSVWIGLGAILEPIISAIANTMIKAVKYINIFVKALTGVDLLAKATQKSLGKTNKSAKALSQTLAGFDELNNIDTTSDVSGTGIDTGWADAFNKTEINTEWADKIKAFGEWVKENKGIIIGAFTGIASGITAIKLGMEGIKALGIGLLVAGVVSAIVGLIEYLKSPSWENFGKIIQGIGIAIIGLGLIIGSIPLVVVGAVVLIVGTIIKYWDKIKEFLQGGIDWLVSQTDWVREKFGIVGEFIYNTFTSLLQGALDIFDTIITTIKGVFDGIIKFIQGVFTGDWEKAWEGIKQIFGSIWEGIKGIASAVWETLKNIFSPVADFFGNIFTKAYDAIKGAFSKIGNFFSGAWEGIKNIFGKVGEFFGNTFSNAWNRVKEVFSTGGKIFDGIKEGIANAFKSIVNVIIKGINKVVSTPFSTINKMLDKIRSTDILGLKPFNFIHTISVPQIPQLAVGTNYVPEDQLAMIHKGEAVIPKKFNSREYFGGSDDETKDLLRELIDKVENIEINPYTTIKDVGKTAINYINSKNRQLGGSVIN